MESELFTKQDWLLFRSRIPGWQETYMDRLNREYIELLSADGIASDKFWALEERIRKDKRSVGVCIDMRRSMFFTNLFSLLGSGVISLDDLNGFSDGVKERLHEFYLRNITEYE